jgi:ABC-type multidrug transport system ATPase subunit
MVNHIDIHEHPEKVQGVIGYVPQDDLLIEELTVFENLYYAAKLCFGHYDEKDIVGLVIRVLSNLGLTEIRDLKVGSPLQKTISGGQRKRVNIALELLREPTILFVDEPTSGLSSRDSENILDLLKELALKGKLLFVVIHQPSSDIFKMFDRLIILDTGGHLIYNGNPIESIVYFKTRIHHANYNDSECHVCGNVNPEQIFNEQGEAQQLKLFPSQLEPPPNDPQVARVLVSKVRLERTRQFGSCWLGLELWKRLGLDRFFEQVVDARGGDVPLLRVTAVLAINRLCAPGSELAIEERWYPSTALDDLLGIDEGKINDSRLYRCLDQVLPHKTKLERHLKQRYGELFGAEFDVLLYDLMSTYVEGETEKNPMMRRGYSRDHRPDCEQMVIALIVNSEGFPFTYETFDGNRADVSTMETILRMVERKYGQARRIWVLDRGIVSEENLAAIRRRGGQYLVGTPRSQMKRFAEGRLDTGAPRSGSQKGNDSAGGGDLYPVPHGGS